MEATPNRTFLCMGATYPYAIKNHRSLVVGAFSWFFMTKESWRSISMKIFHHLEALNQ